jgi:hypothetical protein
MPFTRVLNDPAIIVAAVLNQPLTVTEWESRGLGSRGANR